MCVAVEIDFFTCDISWPDRSHSWTNWHKEQSRGFAQLVPTDRTSGHKLLERYDLKWLVDLHGLVTKFGEVCVNMLVHPYIRLPVLKPMSLLFDNMISLILMKSFSNLYKISWCTTLSDIVKYKVKILKKIE